MSRVFAYVRVSTQGQTVENQIHEIKAAGFAVEPHRVVAETVSGGVQAVKRPAFSKLLDRLEMDDVLVVTKLDRLGRNVIDVRATVDLLANRGVRVHCLALGGADLTSPAGKTVMSVLGAVAEFERDLLVERTQSGLAHARAEGKTPGRPAALDKKQREEVIQRLATGESVNSIALRFHTARRNVQRIKASVSPETSNNVEA